MTTGRSRWWAGPLDVETLAADAVDGVVEATAAVARARGSDAAVSTCDALVAASFAAFENLRIDGAAPATWAELSGFVAARDGWVRVHANYPHHAEAVRRALGVEGRGDLERACARSDATDLEERILGAGGIAAAVRTPARWSAGPHGLATAGEPWSQVTDRGARPPLPELTGDAHDPSSRTPGAGTPMPADARGLLAGVRVLDLTRVIAGPTCSQLLACLGADVLRIDPPHRPEIAAQHLATGMGKRSAVLDLRQEARAARALARAADVVLTGYRPGALEVLGLGTEDLEKLAPEAVVVQLSAWGDTGPWGRRAGFDSIVQAATGIAILCGTRERPGALPVQVLDHASGHLMAAHVLTALAEARARTVRVSLLGAARTLLAAPRPGPGEVVTLPVDRTRQDSDGLIVDAVPPPLLVDGTGITRKIGPYGAALPRWLER